MIKKTFPVVEWMQINITKKDMFYRANGIIISKNTARECYALGLAK